MEGAPQSVEGGPPSPHMSVVVAHVGFKAAAFLYYLTCTWIFSKSYITNFVVCLVLLSLDFWVVKNVSGRILVGLRWWNEVQEGGNSVWRYESLQAGEREINGFDARMFWWPLYATPVAWFAIGLASLFNITKWDYLLIVVIAIVMSAANISGYYRCSKDQQAKFQNLASDAMAAGVRGALFGGWGMGSGGGGGGARPQQGGAQPQGSMA